jgi:hypothetical protein
MSEQSWRDVQLIYRYRAVTGPLHQLFSGDEGLRAVEGRLARLIRDGWVVKTMLAGRTFYALGRRGQRLFQVHEHVGFPFQQAGLTDQIAIALFCAAADYRRLLPEEFHESFPGCHRPQPPDLPAQCYCEDRQHRNHVAWCVVDRGKEQPSRLHQKVAGLINKRRVLPGFQQLLHEGRFEIIVVTVSPERAARLRRVIDDESPLAAPHSVVAVPELFGFLF